MRAEETIASLEGQLKDAPRATEGSERALARDRRALAAGAGTHRRVGKAENAPALLCEGQQEEAASPGEEAAQKARGPAQSWASALAAHPDCGTSDRDLPGLSLALGRDQFGALPRGHRCASPSSGGSDRPSHLQRVVYGLSEMA